jgi:hypothetical protein
MTAVSVAIKRRSRVTASRTNGKAAKRITGDSGASDKASHVVEPKFLKQRVEV